MNKPEPLNDSTKIAVYKLYVDGQLGLSFESLKDAKEAAKVFEAEGRDCSIFIEDK